MLVKDFFAITQCTEAEGAIHATIAIDKEHPIFQGHFPELPVVPGVTMMEMIREVVQSQRQQQYSIAGADNMKFLSVINPNVCTQVEAKIQILTEADMKMEVNATLSAGEITYFKIKATLAQTA